MLRFLFKWLFKVSGWKIKGGIPAEIKKCVLVAAPHTSNWDFVWGLGGLFTFNYKARYLIKKEAYVFPLKGLIKATGGIPVDRSKSNSFVDNMVEELNKRDEMILMFPPEGTRRLVNKWKSGFYHTAIMAKVPIILGYLDYAKKEAAILKIIYPTGNKEADYQLIKDFYKEVTAKHPQWFSIDGIC